MVEPTEFGNLNDAAVYLNLTVRRAIQLQRLMNPVAMVVVEVAGEDASQVSFVHHDHVVEAFSSDASDQPFNERILPGRASSSHDLFDAHVPDAALEVLTIDAVTISQQVSRCAVPRERFDDLLSSPLGRGVCSDVEVQDAPPLMGEDQEDEEHLVVACHIILKSSLVIT